VKLHPGQSTLAFYTAHNKSDKAITGECLVKWVGVAVRGVAALRVGRAASGGPQGHAAVQLQAQSTNYFPRLAPPPTPPLPSPPLSAARRRVHLQCGPPAGGPVLQ
jgi:hypothetical protein